MFAPCMPAARRRLTPGITRPPGPLLKMRSFVSRVGCMPLLDSARVGATPLRIRGFDALAGRVSLQPEGE